MFHKSALLVVPLFCMYALQVQAAPPSGNNWDIIFDEEFSSNTLDTSKWDPEIQWGKKNHGELEYYTPQNLVISNGVLSMIAKPQQMGGMNYTSGAINTDSMVGNGPGTIFTHTYGYTEVCAQLPKGNGEWPAIWELQQNGPNEIDIMENLGQDTHVVYMTLHNDSGQATQGATTDSDPDFSAGYHSYAVDWEPNSLTWYIDGQVRHSTTSGVPSGAMYLILNNALNGNVWGKTVDSSTFANGPQSFNVKYVRVYQHGSGAGATLPERCNGTSITTSSAPVSAPVSTPAPTPASPSSVCATSPITDSQGSTWCIGPDQKIYRDGIVDAVTKRVIYLVYLDDFIYQQNAWYNWYKWTGQTWIEVADPTTTSTSTSTLHHRPHSVE